MGPWLRAGPLPGQAEPARNLRSLWPYMEAGVLGPSAEHRAAAAAAVPAVETPVAHLPPMSSLPRSALPMPLRALRLGVCTAPLAGLRPASVGKRGRLDLSWSTGAWPSRSSSPANRCCFSLTGNWPTVVTLATLFVPPAPHVLALLFHRLLAAALVAFQPAHPFRPCTKPCRLAQHMGLRSLLASGALPSPPIMVELEGSGLYQLGCRAIQLLHQLDALAACAGATTLAKNATGGPPSSPGATCTGARDQGGP